jgi:hypothetical protein
VRVLVDLEQNTAVSTQSRAVDSGQLIGQFLADPPRIVQQWSSDEVNRCRRDLRRESLSQGSASRCGRPERVRLCHEA